MSVTTRIEDQRLAELITWTSHDGMADTNDALRELQLLRSISHQVIPVDRRLLSAIHVRLKHGPFGAGGPGQCDRDCMKCAIDQLLPPKEELR